MSTETPRSLRIAEPIPQSLGSVQNHSSPLGLVRYLYSSASEIPGTFLHVAVHEMDGRLRGTSGHFSYTTMHAHNCWEMDILIPLDHEFLVQVETVEGVSLVAGRKTLAFPARAQHRIEVVAGRGFLVCLVGTEDYISSLLPDGSGEP